MAVNPRSLAYRLIFLARERIEFLQFLPQPAALRRARIALRLQAWIAILLRPAAGLPKIVGPLVVVWPQIIRPLAVRSAQLPALNRHLAPDIVQGE